MSEPQSIQSKGGKARALALSAEERSEISRGAANARWSGHVKPSHLSALIAKFPDFNPEWDEKTKAVWFDSFSKLISLSSPKNL